MAEAGSLEALVLLQQDLTALTESRLLSVDRLWLQLENHIDEFKKVLDKPTRDSLSRQKLAGGKVELRDEEYEVNPEFQQGALQLADALDLDEILAAQIFLDAQDDAILLGRSQLESAVIRFHRQRKYLLDCFRIVLEQSLGTGLDGALDEALDENDRLQLQQLVGAVLNAPQGSSQFIRKCLSAMANNRSWLQSLTEKVNSTSVLGQSQTPEFSEIIQFERLSLVQEHELLGIIISHLIKSNHSALTDLEYVLKIVKNLDKYDNLLVHYFPALGALIQTWVHSDGSPVALEDIKQLHDRHFASKYDQSWTLHYVQAAVSTLWLSEYIAWYDESSADPVLTNVNVADVRNALSERFMETIAEGAFDFFMSMCAEVKPVSWQDPAQHEICDWIDHKGGTLSLPWQRIEHTTRSASSNQDVLSTPIRFSHDFEIALMEQMEMFVDAFICNAPNVLRKLRHDEDEQRQLGQTHEPDMHLEKFMVILSFAFEGRHNAALQAFWSDPDSHMHGFLIWASQRSSTPLIAAFNGMLRSITGDPECAKAAHKFFVDDSTSSSGKVKKAQMSWELVMKELQHFTNKLNERPAITHINVYRDGKPRGDQDEMDALTAESLLVLLMLQTYLHLLTRMCTQSPEARQYLLESNTFDVVEQLFKLISIPSPQVPSLLRGCTFNALESLSLSKTREVSDVMWSAVEYWRSGGYFIPTNLPKVSAIGSTYNTTMDDVLVQIETGFEQANAFVRFLNILVLPDEPGGLNDLLPFPENLGSSSRMPGIFDYVDFVMRVFKNKTCDKLASKKSLEELTEMRVLRWTCLDFISTCLTSFNEDLLIFADQSRIQVDNAMRTSNLENYVKLHPFARVMEWLFNDSVMEALFVAVHQDVVEVGNAEADSPLVRSLLGAIMMMNVVLDVQHAYLSRVRPAIKNEPTLRRVPVSNAAYTSFEDGILKHLSIIASLGGYCTTGHPELTVASLKLLQKLSASPKLISPTSMGPERRLDRNKAVVALELHEDTESISKALVADLNVLDEVDEGVDAPSNAIKASILDLLNASIECLPNRPTVAHLLLGFQCGADALDVPENGPLDRQTSLFHEVMLLALDLPAGKFENHVSSCLISIKSSCLRLLESLWTSPLSSAFVTGQLRANDFLTHLVLGELIVRADTMWDGRLISELEFMFEPSATALTAFLMRRASIFKFLAIELRLLAAEQAPTWKQKIVSTLLGSSKGPGGEHLAHASVFDFFDFMELEVEDHPARPELHYLGNMDLRMCHEIRATGESFNVRKVQELVVLRGRELQNAGQLTTPDAEAQFFAERELLLFYLTKINHLEAIRVARSAALQAWVQLMSMITESGDLGDNRTAFVLQALQLILPKLEKYSAENLPEAIDLARIAKALLFSLDFGSQTLGMEGKLSTDAPSSESLRRGNNAQSSAVHRAAERGQPTELANERLFSLFRVSIRAVHTPSASATFKKIFYSICYRYLAGIVRNTSIRAISQRKQCMKLVRLAGDRLTEIVCDDAYAGEQECRISALLLLGALVTLSREGDPEESKHVIESLARFNFIGILVDGLQNMPNELRDTGDQDTASQIVYCKAKLALLLQIAQTRFGAAHILNARLFRSVKDSGLFSMDPDLGMDLAIPDQEKLYYELLLAIVRVVNACVVSRGAQNEQTLQEGRRFVLENRTSMMTVMKKHAGIGGVDAAVELDVGDLAEAYMLLISVTGFLMSEEQVTRSKKPRVFT